MNVRDLARSIIYGGKQASDVMGKGLSKVGQTVSEAVIYNPNTKRVLPMSPVLNVARAKTQSERDQAMMTMVMGMTSPVNAVSKGKNMLTSLPRTPRDVSNMSPHVIDIVDNAGRVVNTTKPYSSSREAINMAKNQIELPQGGKGFVRSVETQADILRKRISELGKRGASTVNAEKQLAKELQVGKPNTVVDKALSEIDPTRFSSAEEYVKAHKPVYHGTDRIIDTFDDRPRGGITDARSAKEAVWFTDNPDVAKGYAMHAAENGPVLKIQRQIEDAMKVAQKSKLEADWKKYDDLIVKQEDLASYDNTFSRRKLATVNEASIKGDLYTVDAKGKTPIELSADNSLDSWLTSQIEKAKKLGKDGIKILNLDDSAGLYDKPSTHYGIFKTENIKTKSQLTDFYNQAIKKSKK